MNDRDILKGHRNQFSGPHTGKIQDKINNLASK